MLRKLRYEVADERRQETLANIYHAMDETHEQPPTASRLHIGRLTMNTPTGWLARVAAVLLILLGGITLWPSGDGKSNRWWLAPPPAWGQEILATLGTIKAVTCRERKIWVEADGTQHPSSTWGIFYVSSDSYRRDIYDGDVLREVQWYVPDGNGMMQHYVRFDLKCYGVCRHGGSFGVYDPVKRIQLYVENLNNADRRLGEQTIDGHDCVGFEISASKYGKNPATWLDRIWFDKETKLPVRIEQSGRPAADPTITLTEIQDQFDYATRLPAFTFVPEQPPEGFIKGHPDEIRAAGEKERRE
ncbi:MAG: hypothetical protein JW955_05855 [Sedimentisphaerales bacterium]|nr:hypothetical protein [Sedimentisphaerales bacterium]